MPCGYKKCLDPLGYVLLSTLGLLFSIHHGFAAETKAGDAFSSPSSLPQGIALEADPERRRPQVHDLLPGQELVVLAGTSDEHGAFFSIQQTLFEETNQEPIPPVSKDMPAKILVSRGGLDLWATYLNNLRQEYGTSRVLWLNAGDQLQGSLESNEYVDEKGKPAPGAPMVEAFHFLGMTAAAIGNHEFDFGVDVLRDRLRQARYPYLSANLLEKATRQAPHWDNLTPSVMVSTESLRVGIIGLTNVDTPTTTHPHHVQGLEFSPLREATLAQAQALRKQGAQIVVLVAHAGLNCSDVATSKGLRLRSATDPQGRCGEQDEMVQLLHALPAQTVDAVIAGHTHKKVHHFVSQGGKPTPVIEAGHHGQYFHLIYLVYDTHTQQLVAEQTRIEGPVPICERIFSHLRDCKVPVQSSTETRGPLVLPTFHDRLIAPDKTFHARFAQVRVQTETRGRHVVGQATRAIATFGGAESPLGNLATDAMRTAHPDQPADVTLINPGGLRAPFSAGDIHEQDLFRAFPFDNVLCHLQVRGDELEEVLRHALLGRGRPFSLSGATVEFLHAQACGVAKAGEKEDQLYRIRLWDGRVVQKKQWYTLGLADFLVEGGSSLGSSITKTMRTRKRPEETCFENLLIRDIVREYIRKNSPLNSVQHPLVDPQKPRRVFVKIKREGVPLACPQ